MTEVKFRGEISGISLKAGIATLTIKTDLEKTRLDELKVLLDTGLEFTIADNQSTLSSVEVQEFD